LAGRRVSAVIGLALAAAISRAGLVEEIDHFVRVDERVCTGGQPTLEQLGALRDDGICGIIDLRHPAEHDLEAEATEARRLGLRFVSIPVVATSPRPEQADAFLAATADPAVFPLFVHCASGNRVGALWMIRRVLVDGWSPERAEEEARRIGLRSQSLLEFAREYIQAHSRGN
jgi:protein tyrosine phosphatase (PTP) superfamily phosphohydrolase (DUF442 family)